MGLDILGYTLDNFGCHSIYSDTVMAIRLAQYPIYVPVYSMILRDDGVSMPSFGTSENRSNSSVMVSRKP